MIYIDLVLPIEKASAILLSGNIASRVQFNCSHDLFEYPLQIDFKIQIISAFTTSALCTRRSSVCCFPSCALLDEAMLSFDFFAEAKRFFVFF